MLLQLIIGAVAGAGGSSIIARMSESMNMGTLGNVLVGAAGGGLGQVILTNFGGGWVLDIPGIIGLIASGALGGGLLQAAVATLKKRMAK